MRVFTIAAVLLTALSVGVSFANLLHYGAQAGLDGERYLVVQQVLLSGQGAAVVLVDGLALACIAAVAWAARGETANFRLAAVALACMALMLLVWAVFLRPINAQVAGWSAGELPQGWMLLRDKWAQHHMFRFVLGMVGLFCLVSLRVAPPRSRNRWR